MMTVNILDAITSYADNAHGMQMRRYSDERYIVHPVRVMKICQEYSNRLSTHAAALLHDVIEDTPVTGEQMLAFLETVMHPGIAADTIYLVTELTDVYTRAAYPALRRHARKELEVKRLAGVSGEAQTIKYADILDNSRDIVINDPDFAVVYLRESEMLLEHMTRGNPVLYAEVMSFVQQGRAGLQSGH